MELAFISCLSVLFLVVISAEARSSGPPAIRVISLPGSASRPRKPGSRLKPSAPRESTIRRLKPVLAAPRPSVFGLLSQLGLHRMASLLNSSDLEQFLHNSGPVTLFSPTDEAFSLFSVPTSPNVLRNFLLQHAVRGWAKPSELRNDVTLPGLGAASAPLRFNVYENGQVLSISGSQFLDGVDNAGNVRVQPVDRVLWPLSAQDVVAVARREFPRFHDVLVRTMLTDQLSSGTFTMFAAMDDAFDALPLEVQEKLLQNSTLLRRVLLNHIVPGTHYSASLGHGTQLRSLGGDPLHFTTRRGLILVNGVPIVRADVSAANGALHAVSRLVLPQDLQGSSRRQPATIAPTTPALMPEDIFPKDEYPPLYMEPKPSTPRSLAKTVAAPLRLPTGEVLTFATGAALLRRSLLLSSLGQNHTVEGYTLIVPTDAAYAALGRTRLDRMRRDSRLLRREMMSCVIPGRFDSNSGEDSMRSLGGSTVLVRRFGDGQSLTVGGARVLSARPATEGLVLVTDRVAIPVTDKLPPASIFGGSLLADGAVYTIFAPTDSAMSSLTPLQLKDRQFLTDLARSHIVPGVHYRSQLVDGLILKSMAGNTVVVHRSPDGAVLVNDKPVIGNEIPARNGVIHTVDGLFIPHIAQEEEAEDEDVKNIARQFNATQFIGWMRKAQMQNVLKQQATKHGGCTLFLPTDSALDRMSPGLRTALMSSPRQLRTFIQFHISPRQLDFTAMKDNALIPSLLPGKQIRCNIYVNSPIQGILSVSGSTVTAVRRGGGGTAVAVVNETLSPPAGDLATTIAKTPHLTNFSKILSVSGVDQVLKDEKEGPFTVFAPTNCAFEEMDPSEYKNLISSKKAAKIFILQYVVRTCVYRNSMYDGQVLLTEGNTYLAVHITPDCILVSEAKMLHGDMSCSNGVLHVIDRILDDSRTGN